MSLRELRDIVCEKRGLQSDSFILQPLNDASFPVEMNMVLGEIPEKIGLRLVENSMLSILQPIANPFFTEKKLSHLHTLKRRSRSLIGGNSFPKLVEEGDAPKPITKLLGPMFFFTPATAMRYKVRPFSCFCR
jgi:hypothetical protein